jgi:signal transduction histidine kinase
MKSYSLRWRFMIGFIVLQMFTIAVSCVLVLYVATRSSPDGAVPSVGFSEQISQSVHAASDGKVSLVPTQGLSSLMKEWPSLWFVVYLPDGTTITYGTIPDDIGKNTGFLGSFRSVELRGYVDTPERQVRIDKMQTMVGEVTIFAGGVSMSLYQLTFLVGQIAIGVPAAILVVTTIIGVPWVSKWSLKSLDVLNYRLNKVDFHARGGVIDTRKLPKEVLSVVSEINQALRRLDNGFETTERFFVDAAHELRTPIAILQVRADMLPQSEEKSHLQRGIKRLTAITNQLLDIETYRQKPPTKVGFDLTKLVAGVVADLAPFAIVEGYDISFEADVQEVGMEGDPDALDRAFANLIRNAIQHGGKNGDITVRIEADGSVLVTDQGPGIPAHQRSRIFDPFYRLNPHGAGAGLGLSMVNDIVEGHNGFVEVSSLVGGGSAFAVRWRKPAKHATL